MLDFLKSAAKDTPLVDDVEAGPPSEISTLLHPNKDNGHDHSHDHDNNNTSTTTTKTDHVLRRLQIATALCLVFMTVEVIGGWLAGSLAVLSDAAHLAADLASFAVAIVAALLSARPSTPFHTYGLKRTESLAALFSMSTLAIISIGLALEAIRRIYGMLSGGEEADQQVDGRLMSGIATIGVLVNIALAAVLGENHTHLPGGGGHDHDHGDHGHDHSHEDHQSHRGSIHADEVEAPKENNEKPRNVNLQAAYLHVMADLAQSVAVLIAGLIIWYNPEWKIVDPIATILFCILVFYSTLGVIRSAVCVLLEEVPPDISWTTIHDNIQTVEGVQEVHDLHVWSISHGINALSVHLKLKYYEQKAPQQANRVLAEVAQIAQTNGIQHSTIQIQHNTSDALVADLDCIPCELGEQSQDCVVGGGF